eukprot:CAMPEP_0197034152 /NCGR_PEP_ID=MMETSP1384-20130603/12344_1 /TAXON_ID=29189 /ORGANISM="Ammonia sp." /LENGTH=291 /DNA_ID=CAMNT_0042464041 /DNA_START=281 /DNA_END=1156 /DNA_ORIENTATION=-
MPAMQVIANAQYFGLRGKFCKCSALASGYQFVYNCKVNKYVSPENCPPVDGDQSRPRITVKHQGKSYPFSVPVSTPVTPNGFSMELHALSSESDDDAEDADASVTNLHLNAAPDAGDAKATATESNEEQKSKGVSLALRMDRIYESHTAVMQRLKAMDDEIQSLQQTISCGEYATVVREEKEPEVDERKSEEEGMENKAHLSVSTPVKTMTSSLCKEGTLTPMDTSMTLTPIGSEVEHNVHHVRQSNYAPQTRSAHKLGVIVVPDITSSRSSVGGRFTVVDSSMSMSATRQ